mgnify:CR=1 FL=1
MSKRVREIEPFRFFVDGENCNPYRLAAMFDSLKGYEIQKIDKVVNFAFQTTPLCRVRNFSYEFAMRSKNKILRDSKRQLISKVQSHFSAI